MPLYAKYIGINNPPFVNNEIYGPLRSIFTSSNGVILYTTVITSINGDRISTTINSDEVDFIFFYKPEKHSESADILIEEIERLVIKMRKENNFKRRKILKSKINDLKNAMKMT